MEARSSSRRLAPEAREGVEALLPALRESIGAQAVGLFDDDRGQLHASDHPGDPNFWDAFGGLPCVDVDWRRWYLELRTGKRTEAICTCGQGHTLLGFLIHDRWALLVALSHGSAPGAVGVTASALKALARLLPTARRRDLDAPHAEDALGGDSRVAETGIPIWWLRKTRR